VINIKRAAQLLDGTIIPAGASFSMNDALGQRTLEKGFVPAPMIAGGRLVDSVGGGIGQVATTIYNAAFFAGLDLVEHTHNRLRPGIYRLQQAFPSPVAPAEPSKVRSFRSHDDFRRLGVEIEP
jgi:vancomycin resistance protein YoaR